MPLVAHSHFFDRSRQRRRAGNRRGTRTVRVRQHASSCAYWEAWRLMVNTHAAKRTTAIYARTLARPLTTGALALHHTLRYAARICRAATSTCLPRAFYFTTTTTRHLCVGDCLATMRANYKISAYHYAWRTRAPAYCATSKYYTPADRRHHPAATRSAHHTRSRRQTALRSTLSSAQRAMTRQRHAPLHCCRAMGDVSSNSRLLTPGAISKTAGENSVNAHALRCTYPYLYALRKALNWEHHSRTTRG